MQQTVDTTRLASNISHLFMGDAFGQRALSSMSLGVKPEDLPDPLLTQIPRLPGDSKSATTMRGTEPRH
eukprot:637873-Amphidinium_carterae.1